MAQEGDICDKCRDAGYRPETIPEEYRELFRSARVLFEEGVTEEEVIIPTLAFAANSWERAELVSIRDKFMEASEGSQAWIELDNQFFYDRYHTLKPLRVIEGTLVVYRFPHEAEITLDDVDLAKEIRIDVRKLSSTPEEVANFYERCLRKSKAYYAEGRGNLGLRKIPGWIEGDFRQDARIRILAWPEEKPTPPTWHQWPFPHPETIRINYKHLRQLLKKQSKTDDVPLIDPEKPSSAKPYNLIPACVYWYVGNRGEVLSSPSGSALQRTTHELLKKHLLEPCEDKIPIKRTEFPRDARVVKQRILRVDRVLRN